ncbi:MAG: ATP-binding protein [Spartobacteria bacterium]|nr:ATP-binding protein [Spartobacteria bacterium]
MPVLKDHVERWIAKPQYRRWLYHIAALVIGGAMGWFVLYPANEFVSYFEVTSRTTGPLRFVIDQMIESITGETPYKTIYYTLLGMVIGLIQSKILSSFRKRVVSIQQLSEELERNISHVIARGEGPSLEFKSTFRWDVEKERANKAMEFSVLKTIAAFLNSEGGTLLIGVQDNGSVYGLENDYKTLRKKNRDGFDQIVVTSIAHNMGTNVCANVHLLFHELNDHDICRILVTRSTQPVFLKADGASKFYVRTGAATRELNVEEALSYSASHFQ